MQNVSDTVYLDKILLYILGPVLKYYVNAHARLHNTGSRYVFTSTPFRITR